MKKFEYRILEVSANVGFWGGKIDTQELTDKLNEMGREGWEVVSAADTDFSGGGTRKLIVMLKRQIE